MPTTNSVKTKRPQGVILYRGPSLLDGKPIICVAVNLARKSKNHKTGNMIGSYILADGDEDPMVARKSGGDHAVCGDCPHRNGACYVNLVQGPLAVWRAARAGNYPILRKKHLKLFARRHVRLGSYGDPVAVPLAAWLPILDACKGHSGYTHQWRTCDQEWRKHVMASCDSAWQRADALALGWRTFRIRLAEQPLEKGEFVCPASDEAGKRLTCAECLACSGATSSPRAATPAIIFHGTRIADHWALRMFKQTQEKITAEESRRYALPVMGRMT